MRLLAVVLLGLLLTGCETVSGWFGSAPKQKAAELVTFQAKATARILWQGSVGDAGQSAFYPAISGNTVYVADASGQVAALAGG